MARVHRVASSRTPHTCRRGHVIEPPQGYAWAAPGYRGRKIIACDRHPFRPSELTTSARATVLAAQETADDALNALGPDATYEDLDGIRDEYLSAVQEYLADREEALNQWEHGNSQLEELRDSAQEAVDAIESHEVEEYAGDDGPDDHADDGTDWEPSGEYAEWLEAQREALADAISQSADAA